jgi:hypothetical protein
MPVLKPRSIYLYPFLNSLVSDETLYPVFNFIADLPNLRNGQPLRVL